MSSLHALSDISEALAAKYLRDAEIVNVPFWAVLGGCSARRVECRVAGHTNATQRRNAPASAVQKWDIGSFRIP